MLPVPTVVAVLLFFHILMTRRESVMRFGLRAASVRIAMILLVGGLISSAAAEQGAGSIELASPMGSLGPVVRVDRSEPVAASRLDPAPTKVRFVYQNRSGRALTAWSHRCVVASNDGRSGWSGTSVDVFSSLVLPYGIEDVEERLIQPGETLQFEVGEDFHRDGPYAIQTCGLVAVVFDDGTALGSPELLDDIFARRRALAKNVLETLEALQDAEGLGGVSSAESLERVLGRPAVRGPYEPQLAGLIAETGRTGRVSSRDLRSLEAQVTVDYERALLHLRPDDRRILTGDDSHE